MQDIILLGAGGHARSVIDSIIAGKKYRVVGYSDNHEYYDGKYEVICNDSGLEQLYLSGVHYAFVCIGYLGNNDIREQLYERLKQIGFHIPVIIDPTAAIAVDAVIGEGTYIGKCAVVNSNANVGKMAIINSGAIIEHDCAIGEFTHISVGSIICGGSQVGRAAFIGANATVIQQLNIGERTIIGAGSVVLSDIGADQKKSGVIKKTGAKEI